MHNLLQGERAGRLATVVYSDRYFRYGLALRARDASARRLVADELGAGTVERRLSPSTPRPHAMPLRVPTPRIAPRAGVISAGARFSPPAPSRFSDGRPKRAGPPRLLLVESDARFEEGPAIGAARPRRALDYRQGSRGVAPCVPAVVPRWRRSPPPSPASTPEKAPRPQFALPDEPEPTPERAEAAGPGATYEALAKSLSRVSAANLSPTAPSDKTSAKALARKVLNTERYNNGARCSERPASSASRGSGGSAGRLGSGGPSGRRGSGGPGGSRALRLQRATIRAMLAFSGLFYAVSFLAFYFLSLP